MSDPRRHPNVVNLDELEPREMLFGQNFGARNVSLSEATGGQALGCRWYEVPAGRAAMPRHWHGGCEEVLFILSGEGSLRVGEDTVALRAGDYVSFPAGPESAHQLHNSGEAPLRYLCLSTQPNTDVIGYPDSDKVMAWTASAGTGAESWHKSIHRVGDKVGYFEGEDLG